jgi:hypothetical protein
VAAGYADVALFLADGRIAGRMEGPTPERVLDRGGFGGFASEASTEEPGGQAEPSVTPRWIQRHSGSR